MISWDLLNTSCTTTPTISSIKLMYNQQSEMVTWVTGVILDGLGPLSNPPTYTNSFSCIIRGKLAGLFRPRYTSTIIRYNNHSQIDTITNYISPTIITIRTDITLLFFTNLFIYMARRYWKSQQSTTATSVMGVIVAGMRPILTPPFNINSCYLIYRGILAGIL